MEIKMKFEDKVNEIFSEEKIEKGDLVRYKVNGKQGVVIRLSADEAYVFFSADDRKYVETKDLKKEKK